MANVFEAVAVLALLGVVLLLFANSALLKMVRDLQQALAETGGGGLGATPAMTLPQFAAGDGRATYVLVVDAGCPACRDRAADYARLGGGPTGGELVALVKDRTCAEWFDGSAVRVVLDPALLGTVGVGVTPMLLKYAADGTEQWRRVIGSRQDLQRFTAAQAMEANETEAAEHDAVGRA